MHCMTARPKHIPHKTIGTGLVIFLTVVLLTGLVLGAVFCNRAVTVNIVDSIEVSDGFALDVPRGGTATENFTLTNLTESDLDVYITALDVPAGVEVTFDSPVTVPAYGSAGVAVTATASAEAEQGVITFSFAL